MSEDIFGYMWLCSEHEDCLFNKEVFPASADFGNPLKAVRSDPHTVTLHDAGKRKHVLVMATGVVSRKRFLEFKDKTKDRLITSSA